MFQLHQLIAHNSNSKEFDLFVREMGAASASAQTEFIKILRRFELSDYADLTDLIVKSEGISLKQYLLELFALAWVSLAESTDGLVEALDKLNKLDLTVTDYPPNAFVPSEAVLELYERALYRPAKAIGNVGEFGDLRLGDVFQSPVPANGVPTLYLVIVQDCDMLRGGVPDAAFLITGSVFP